MNELKNPASESSAVDAGNSGPRGLPFPRRGPADTAGLWLNHSVRLWPTSHWTNLSATRVCAQAMVCSQTWSKFNALDAVWALPKTLYQATAE